MLAIMMDPQTRKRKLELINKIWDELEKLFGKKKAKEWKEFLKNYIEDNDGQVKTIPRLAAKLEELRELVARRSKKQKDFEPDPKYLLPGETEDGNSPWPENQ